jgi:cell division protein FtsB
VNRDVRLAHTELDSIQAVKQGLEQRVRGLRNTSLDVDLLEERARVVLNLMRDDELLIQFHSR